MKFKETRVPGVIIVEPQVFGDERGFFMETFHMEKFSAAGLPTHFVQDNHSRSEAGVLRGLHFQRPRAQGKLVRAIAGEIYDVAVDIRADSPAFGQWVGVILSASNKRQLWVPPGFAHGFCVTSDIAEIAYKCTDLYTPECEISIIWDDLDLKIDWPVSKPILSARDKDGRPLSETTNLPMMADKHANA